jgi:hypothetical protein
VVERVARAGPVIAIGCVTAGLLEQHEKGFGVCVAGQVGPRRQARDDGIGVDCGAYGVEFDRQAEGSGEPTDRVGGRARTGELADEFAPFARVRRQTSHQGPVVDAVDRAEVLGDQLSAAGARFLECRPGERGPGKRFLAQAGIGSPTSRGSTSQRRFPVGSSW